MLHDICVSKTGTLTEGKLSVAKIQLCDSDEIINTKIDEKGA